MINKLIILADRLDIINSFATQQIDYLIKLAAADDWDDEEITKTDIKPLKALPVLDLSQFKKAPSSPSEITNQLRTIFFHHHNPATWTPQIKSIVSKLIKLLHQFV